MTYEEAWRDLEIRLAKADKKLRDSIGPNTTFKETDRLLAKASGVRLAASYMKDYEIHE